MGGYGDVQMIDENGSYNFDLPTALNQEELENDLGKLQSNQKIIVKEYNFNAPIKKHVFITIEPSEIILVEGLFLFYYKGVRSKLDFSVFIDVDPQTQLDRRLYRDQETRGYSRDGILYQWQKHVIPCYQKYLLPFKDDADFHFRNDSNSDQDFKILVKEIAIRIEQAKIC